MSEVINMFPNSSIAGELVDLSTVLVNAEKESKDYNKGVVILINDRAGTWELKWDVAGLTNSETLLAVQILKEKLIRGIVL
jgi:YD repeat-containing protein